MRRYPAILSATLIAALATSAANAHGIWFAERGRHTAMVYGIGADDLDMVSHLPQVEAITAFDAAYRPITATLRVAGPVVLVDAATKPVLIAAILQNGIWSRKGSAEFVKGGRDAVPDATLSEKTVKYAVSIHGPLPRTIPALPGQRLQIVPAAIPATRGTPLTYTILYDGKPVAGARVIADMLGDPDATETATTADGIVTLPVRNQGLNVIRAVFEGPSDDKARYDRIEHTATLSFTLPHAPE